MRNYFYSRYHPGNRTVVSHELNSFSVIEYVLLHEKPKLIIEFGTFYCGVTALFHETEKSIEIHTFDYRNFMKDLRKAHKRITLDELTKFKNRVFGENVYFYFENILKGTNQKVVDLLLHPEKKLLYCDNGNKIKEIEMYAKFLQPGDLLGVHDWGHEINFQDIEEVIKTENFVAMKYNEILEERECTTRFFIKGL